MADEQHPPTAVAKSLKERMREAQQSPMVSPSSSPVTPEPSSVPPLFTPAPSPVREASMQVRAKREPVESRAKRATHFTEEETGIAWVRTGVTIPMAYWKAFEAFVHEAKQDWQPGEERVTQNQLLVDAMGTWINDHRSKLAPRVVAAFDEVFRKIPRIQ
jgi:hypothetical protein